MRDGVAVLVAKYANDSVASQFTRISSSSTYTMRISNDSNLKVKEVKGYFLLNSGSGIASKSTTLRLMSVYDIHLVRLRAAKQTPSSAQTANNDSAARRHPKGDSVGRKPIATPQSPAPLPKEPIKLEPKEKVLPPPGNKVFKRIPADTRL